MYNEIFKLCKMLDDEGLEYIFRNRSRYYTHYQILLTDKVGNVIVSIIQGKLTYGGTENKLEIMGLLTPEEAEMDEVVGYLSAEEVYKRIMNYYENIWK